MAGKLQEEIKQSKAFQRPEEEAILNIVKTADVLDWKLTEFLKDFGLSGTQYNFLRILRGAGPEGLPCGEVGSRMVTRDPDITRLIDRLETRELVTRKRSEQDRRVITIRISRQGLMLLSEIDGPLEIMLDRILGQMGRKKLSALIDLLEEARDLAHRASIPTKS